jgi:hypothetical protein
MSKYERGVVKDSNLMIGLGDIATKSMTNGPRRRVGDVDIFQGFPMLCYMKTFAQHISFRTKIAHNKTNTHTNFLDQTITVTQANSLL